MPTFHSKGELMAKKQIPDLVVKSKAKDLLAKAGCRSSSDVFDAVNGLIAWYLEQAAKRAKANGRQTVRGHDFMVE
jgi:histone H3/H4